MQWLKRRHGKVCGDLPEGRCDDLWRVGEPGQENAHNDDGVIEGPATTNLHGLMLVEGAQLGRHIMLIAQLLQASRACYNRCCYVELIKRCCWCNESRW